jgi:ketosteroid isomerase-like protein
MIITSDYVREIFKGLVHGDGAAFFAHVADDVDWTVNSLIHTARAGFRALPALKRVTRRSSFEMVLHETDLYLDVRGGGGSLRHHCNAIDSRRCRR